MIRKAGGERTYLDAIKACWPTAASTSSTITPKCTSFTRSPTCFSMTSATRSAVRLLVVQLLSLAPLRHHREEINPLPGNIHHRKSKP